MLQGLQDFKSQRLYVPVVTLKTSDNNKLNELLNIEFKRLVYWNEYKSKIEIVTQAQDDNNFKRTLLDSLCQGVSRLFVISFNDINNNVNRVIKNSHRRYFLPGINIKDYNVLVDCRNFYDQNISDDFKKYEELRKIMIGKGEDYITGSLLDNDYYKKKS